MRLLAPRPVLLLMTLVLVIGAIAFIEFRFNTAQSDTAQTPPVETTAESTAEPTTPEETTTKPVTTPEKTTKPETTQESKPITSPEETDSEAERIAKKEEKYDQAKEIVGSTGLINAESVSIKEAAGDSVVLLQFWTYSCFNCQNVQPYINSYHDKYADDGLQVIGIHKPEFEFEKDYASVAEAVQLENIQYPIVLDNNDATWDAYNQRYWPTWYLIDADGFVRYKHIGEGGYDATEREIQELLEERDQISG